MATLDLDALLAQVSEEEPAGPDLEYDGDFTALEAASQGKPEQQYGDTIIPAEEPDWKEVKRLGAQIATRTKDLRAACMLARGLIAQDGFTGFADGLKLIRGYVEQYWDGIHPRLDPEDAMDPTERVNILSSLADKQTTVAMLMKAPLVRSQVFGPFCMNDVLIARGELPAPSNDDAPEMAAISGAMVECEIEQLESTLAALDESLETVVQIEDRVTNNVGVSNAVSLDRLGDCLKSIRKFLASQVAARGGETGGDEEAGDGAEGPQQGAAEGGPVAVASVPGEVRSREDVIRTLDKVCGYYEKFEPSSPVPMLLKRAKRLATMNFLDILEDLSPDGVSQARLIGGVDSGGDDD